MLSPMKARAATKVTAALLLNAAVCSCFAGPPAASHVIDSTTHTHEFMLYLSQGIGGGAKGPAFGLRISQVRMSSGPAAAQTSGWNPVQEHELLNWSVQRHSNVKMEFGHNVTWDMSRHTIGPRSTSGQLAFSMPARPTITPSVPPPASRASGSLQSRIFAAVQNRAASVSPR
jgi:hypothetical protein